MEALTDNGGYVLAADGDRLLFLRRRILPTWLAFVSGVLAVVAVGNGAVQVAFGQVAVGAVLIVVGVAFASGLRAVLQSGRQAMAAPLDPGTAVLVIDLAARTLLDGRGAVLAPLEAVRVSRSMQATSSALALRVTWPGGAVVVYRGDALAFGGSVDAAAEALRARGIPVA